MLPPAPSMGLSGVIFSNSTTTASELIVPALSSLLAQNNDFKDELPVIITLFTTSVLQKLNILYPEMFNRYNRAAFHLDFI